MSVSTDHQTAILRNFPIEADTYLVWLAIERVIERTSKVASGVALRGLISDLGPIYAKHSGRRVTLRPNCPFVSLVAATANACGWNATRETICDLEMRMHRPDTRRTFGRRAA